MPCRSCWPRRNSGSYMYERIRALPQDQACCSRWISGTTANMRTAASRAAEAICTSTQTAILSPARSSIIPIPTSAKKRCWRRCKARCSWPIVHNQPFNRNLLRPCPVLDNPGRLTQMVDKLRRKIHRPDAPGGTSGRSPINACRWPSAGRPSPTSSGVAHMTAAAAQAAASNP